jgi:hypothetical protein
MKEIVEIKTEEDALSFIENDGGMADAPESLRTEKVCRTAIQKRDNSIKDIPEALKTAEFYLSIVQEDGWMLFFVPEGLKTLEICRAAFKQYQGTLRFMPKALRGSYEDSGKLRNQRHLQGACYI